MNQHLKLAYDYGAKQALMDLGLSKKEAAVPGPGFLQSLGLKGIINTPGRLSFLPKTRGPKGNFYEGLHEGGLSGLGYTGDLGLLAVATTPMAADD
jgi:hypothetical protein